MEEGAKPDGKWKKRGVLLVLAILWMLVYYLIAPQHFEYLLGKIQQTSQENTPIPVVSPMQNPPVPNTWLPPRMITRPPKRTRPPPTSQAPKLGKDNLFRLPKTVQPIHYDLTIKANILGYGYKPKNPAENSTFEGKVKIQLQILKPTRIILLSSQDLNIEQLKISGASDIELKKYTVFQNYIAIELREKAQKNSIFSISIRYSANIRKDNKGFYDTTYYDEQNKPKVAVVTQLEPDYARLVVPCFDEPEFKAVWKIKIIHPVGTSAISNADQVKVEAYSEQFQISEFHETPKMSTYLLAFFISDFKYLEGFTQSGIRVRIWSRPEDIQNHHLALQSAIETLDNFEKFFDIPYPMNKMDMVGVRNFAAGAMENWGLITYREILLSYNPRMNTPWEKANIRRVVSHELVHQWFGNLVTMNYWDQTWLNEGFATLYQMYGADLLTNGTYREREFIIHPFQQKALYQETEKPKHAMSFEIAKNDTVHDFFDVITYQKAGSILSMFRRVLGEDEFLAGIRQYLKAHMYTNTKEEQLFKYIGASFGGNFESFSKSWTNSEGFPIVNARILEENPNLVELSQEDPDGQWEIPVYYQTLHGVAQKPELVWLKSEPVTIPYTPGALLILNPDSHGHFRVDYQSMELWEAIVGQLEKDPRVLSTATKIRIIDDAFIFRHPESLRKYILKETQRLPILAYLLNLQGHDEELRRVLSGLEVEKSWDYVEDNYVKDEMFQEVDLATQIISTECMVNPIDCYQKSEHYYLKMLKTCQFPGVQISNCSMVPPPLRKTVYCAALLNQKHVDLLKTWQENERRASEKENLKQAFENCQPKPVLERKGRKLGRKLNLFWNLEMEQKMYLEN